MNINEERDRIRVELTALKEKVDEVFGKSIGRLKTSELRAKAEHFRDVEIQKVSIALDEATKVLDSPVYVGLLGRYSHGKSALVNALFGLDDESQLPTGEGIVTAKVTRVEFNGAATRPRCFEVLGDESRREISLETLRERVSGRAAASVSGETSLVHFYDLSLPVGAPFSRLFEQKKIKLVDLPGLGGRYFTDTEQTRAYIRKLDMLLVVINITDLTGAARFVDPYLVDAGSRNIIPVLTFFDKAQAANEFKGLPDDEVLEKAKEIIRDTMPHVKEQVSRVIAVSAIKGFQIGVLQELILKFVQEQNLAIEAVKRETPPVFKRKLEGLRTQMGDLTAKVESALRKWEQEVGPILQGPRGKGVESLKSYLKRETERCTLDVKRRLRSAKDVQDKLRQRAEEFRSAGTWDRVSHMLKDIETEMNQSALYGIEKEISDEFAEYKDKCSTKVERYVDQLDIEEAARSDLKDRAEEIISDAKVEYDYVPYRAPETAAERAKMEALSTIDLVTENLKSPGFMIPLGLGIAAILIGGFFGHYFFIGGAIVIGATILGGFATAPGIRRRRFLEIMGPLNDKLVRSFDRDAFESAVMASAAKAQAHLIEELEESFRDVTDPYGHDIRNMREMGNQLSEAIQGFLKQMARAQDRLGVR